MDRHIDQWSRTEHLKINPFIYSPLIFDKDANPINWERAVFSTMAPGWLDFHRNKNEVGPLLHITHDYDHKHRSQNHETLEGDGEQHFATSLVSGSLDATPSTSRGDEQRSWVSSALKPLYVEGVIKKRRENPEWEKIFANYRTWQGFNIKTYSQQQQQNSTTKGQTASLKMNKGGNSLAVQWSQLQTFTARDLGPSSASVREIRFFQALGAQPKGQRAWIDISP